MDPQLQPQQRHPFCRVFPGDYQLLFTSLINFKVSSLQVPCTFPCDVQKN